MTAADVVLAKVATMERCRARIAEIRSPARQPHLLPVDVEDLLAVNLQRAAQAAIDLAMHVVSSEGYGVPAELGEVFTLLAKHGLIDEELGFWTTWVSNSSSTTDSNSDRAGASRGPRPQRTTRANT